ncbi:hypothetical protein ACQ4PT_071576 [Festuca glaucescens]
MAQDQSATKDVDQDLVASLPTRDGWSSPLTLYNDYWLRSHMVSKFMLVRDNFKPRHDDIILATHPKSGTTWLKSLAFTISTRSRFTFDNTPLLTSNPQRVVPFIGVMGGDLDHIETLPSSRLLSTHLPLSLLPPAVSTVGCRVVYLSREPKDALVSRWHFENKISTGAPISLDNFFNMYCQGFSPFGPFWDHYLEYWKESLARPHEVMFLRYEEIVSDPLKVVTCAGVERAEGKIFLEASALFRKGKVGDWVNHMSNDMAEAMDRLVEVNLKGSGLEF